MAAKKKATRQTRSKRPEAAVAPAQAPADLPPATAGSSSPGVAATQPGLPVVGICASAGGLDAFKKFFTAMPADSGLVFVLIPHLDPTHKSLMVDLLARSTAMPVVEAEEDMPVAADRVYVLPPNRYMTIGGGKLHLTGPVERGGLQTSIDLFLRSLAEDRQEQAIGIVLSGTGAHGTLGLKAIKANGGMAMVQDPGTAEYDSMPRSAIATGQADYILPPEQMPQALIRYVQHFSTTLLRDDTGQAIAVALTARDVTERKRVRESLESLVEERTSQLEAANRALQADITERQKAQEENLRLTAELRHRVEELQALLDVLPVGVGIAYDPDCRRITGNHFATEFLQLPPSANMSTSAPPDERPAYKVCHGGRELTPREQPMRQACARNTIIRDAEEDIVLPDGQVRTVSVSAAPLHDQAGNVRGCVGVFWDVTERKRALRESWDRLTAIVNTAAEGIITIDERGIIESVNPSAERMFGYTRVEMIGQNVKILMPTPYRDEHDNFLARYLKTGTKKIIGIGREVSGRRKDGSTFFLDLAVSELHDGNRRLFTGILRDVTERKALEREVLEIAAVEQRRIGHDLHDTAGQELTALGLMTDSLVAALEDHSPTDVPLAAKIVQGLRRTLSHVRALSRGLVPVEVSAHGLMAALADLTARINGESGVTCTFACENPAPVEDNATATHLYRIAQEAVSNALKHGQAKHIEVGLRFTDGLLTLRIADDGVGMRNQGAKAEGQGLRIMRYRADSIRAILFIESPAQGGTLVTCTLSVSISHEAK